MTISGIHFLPLLLFILFPFTFLGTYIAAVLQGHVEPNFPYISDAATYSPESCVFGQFINIGAVLLCILIYVRYCEICQYYELYSISNRVIQLNKLGLWLGIFSCLGLSIVANFQETNVKYVHYFGATLCFGLGTAYFWIQAMCSYHMHSLANSLMVAHFRVGLAMVCTVFFFIAAVAGLLSHLEFHGETPAKWYPKDGGWELHVISTASEWVVAICFCFYILTFYSEFSLISFSHPQIFVNTNHILLNAREDLGS
ncbi:DNA damage-regulated autophagy modulator protein 2 [Rhodnius prolixus]|uniref:Putative dna damage-regulated autophagy modulator protein 2 n=1 Tax=Rhodnius prolixus TaxID=13249 RepID=A0A4P6D924_RHOPR